MANAKSTTAVTSDRELRTLQPEERPYERRIAGFPGLLLRVQPSGTKTWYFEPARHKRVKLGRYPQHTLSWARAETFRVIERLNAGESPRPEHLRPAPPSSKPDTLMELFADYERWYTDKRKADGFRANGLEPLRTLLKDIGERPTTISTDQLDAWRRKQRVNPDTTNRRVRGLRSMFNWAVAEGRVATNPCVGLKPLAKRKNVDQRARALTEDEERRLRKALKGSRIEPLWLLAVNTGLRRGELFQLRWDDINGKELRVRRSKTGKPRDVPLNDEACAALAMLDRRTKLVFPGPIPGQPLTTIKTAWETVRTAAKIEQTWHESTRHTFVSRLLAKGVATWVVAKVAGHSSEQMTQHYGHLMQEDARTAVELLTGVRR